MKTLKDYEYFRTDLGVLYKGDCLEILPLIDKKIDMILCDLPYGTTSCSWDIVIPFELLWSEYKRLIIDNGAIVLTGSQPFTTDLINSNREWFKYEWIWNKVQTTNFFLAKKQPLKQHENICVFYKNQCNYNPILKNNTTKVFGKNHKSKSECYGESNEDYKTGVGYPKSIIKYRKYNNLDKNGNLHPTQKPDELFLYLIKTYTDKNMIVLDNCSGSGTTAVACEKLGRRWLGIEISEKYCQIAKQRIKAEADQIKMF
jgi:site-specific DNA-methyltransferase (adenine-specific)